MENGILSPTEITNGTELIAKFDGLTQKENGFWGYEKGFSRVLKFSQKELEKTYFEYHEIIYMLDKISELKIDSYTPFFLHLQILVVLLKLIIIKLSAKVVTIC